MAYNDLTEDEKISRHLEEAYRIYIRVHVHNSKYAKASFLWDKFNAASYKAFLKIAKEIGI